MSAPPEKQLQSVTFKQGRLNPLESSADLVGKNGQNVVHRRPLSSIHPPKSIPENDLEFDNDDYSVDSASKSNPPDSDDAANAKTCRSKCFRVVKILVKHLSSFAISMAYMAMGGQLFVFLELENEKSGCFTLAKSFAEKYNSTLGRATILAESGFNTSTLNDKFSELLAEYAKDLYKLSFDPEMDCTTIGDSDNLPSWNFVNSMYFCATIMTTIGYGHISPSTMWGQIVCIIYSVIGIPIMLIFLSNIGDVMANIFRYLYLNLCCCKCFVKHYKQRLNANGEPIDTASVGGGEDGSNNNNWAKVDPNSEELPPPRMGPIVVEDDEELEEEDYSEMEINVPITVALILLIVYILIGAGLFMIWETEWSIVEATYFAFITLSTIGFGDYYPAKDGGFQSQKTIVELIIGMMYCFIGLAWLSMCINLIQDEIAAKVVWLGSKVGCIKKEDPDADDPDHQHNDDTDSCLNEVEPIPPPITKHPLAPPTAPPSKGFSQTEC